MVHNGASNSKHTALCHCRKEKTMLAWDEKRMNRGKCGPRSSPARKAGLAALGLFLLLLIVVLCAALSQHLRWEITYGRKRTTTTKRDKKSIGRAHSDAPAETQEMEFSAGIRRCVRHERRYFGADRARRDEYAPVGHDAHCQELECIGVEVVSGHFLMQAGALTRLRCASCSSRTETSCRNRGKLRNGARRARACPSRN